MNFNDFWYWLSNGTGAEWISSIGALVAIVFAYWQIYEQRKEYENDRREEKVEKRLSNRPFFTVIQKNIIFFFIRKIEIKRKYLFLKGIFMNLGV